MCFFFTLTAFEKSLSAKVNWSKSEALCWGHEVFAQQLPGNLNWNSEGLKFVGMFLGTDTYKMTTWKGLIDKICAGLSKWKWLLLPLSYRGRVLILNNLIASALWHRMSILEPQGAVELNPTKNSSRASSGWEQLFYTYLFRRGSTALQTSKVGMQSFDCRLLKGWCQLGTDRLCSLEKGSWIGNCF